MPMRRWMRQPSIARPPSTNARCHAKTCAYTVSTRVPSRSRSSRARVSPPVPAGIIACARQRTDCALFDRRSRNLPTRASAAAGAMRGSTGRSAAGARLPPRTPPPAPPVTVTDRHARGLVRRFLEDEQERAAEARRRRRRQPLHGAPTLRAAHRVLAGLDKAWSPRALVSYTDTTPDGVARLAVACLEQTGSAWLAEWPGVAARSFVRRYLIRPGDTIYRSKWRGHAALNHSLERVIQRGRNWRVTARGCASRCSSPIRACTNSQWRAVSGRCWCRDIRACSSATSSPRCRSSASTPSCRSTRPPHGSLRPRRRARAAALGGDRYEDLVPAFFYPGEPNELMDEALAAYERHAALLRRPHQSGEDWFGLALAQKETDDNGG